MNRIEQVDHNEHDGQQDDVQHNAQTGKVGEMERARTIHQHVGRTADG